ncbi:MAG: gliding motility-associated lipoprotein GldH [Flavobacterium sp.]|jgi:gliding motility-associated lipoprotein GldH
MKILVNFLLLVLIISLVSCDENRVFDQYKSVDNNWHKDSIVSFELPKLEKGSKYNMYVNIRDNKDFPYSNLFLIVMLEQPNKKTLVDTLQWQMANPDGSLLGDGFSDVKENKLVYKLNEEITQKGNYTVSIQQAVRPIGKVKGDTNLKGVTEVGFRIESIE